MRIVRVELQPLPLRLRAPYTIAYETIDHVDNVIVRLITDSPHTGLGVAAPDPGVTGETGATALAALQAMDVVGLDPLAREVVLHRASAALATHPSARAALDMALWDLLGKAAGQSVHRLIGGFRERIPTSITLGIEPLDETVRQAKDRVAEGFIALKLKGGVDLDEDVAKTEAVRAAIGPDVAIRFDANQGYTVEQAIAYVDRTLACRIEILEQPTARAEPALLRKVARKVPIPVMVDESLMTLDDALAIAAGGLADMVNVKLMKVGGLGEALHIASVARAADLEVMVGCMDESALAIAAGLHLALARPQVAYADLDGHLDVLEDPFEGVVILEDGYLRPTGRPGLGW